MRFRILSIVLFISLIFFNCEKDKADYKTIFIKTDKKEYTTQEPIMVEITNLTDSTAYYYRCGPAYLSCIPPTVLKFEGNTWTGLWSPICDCFTSHCCGELMPGEVYGDIITSYPIIFEKGMYKIEYTFTIRDGEGYQSYYSNEFKIE